MLYIVVTKAKNIHARSYFGAGNSSAVAHWMIVALVQASTVAVTAAGVVEILRLFKIFGLFYSLTLLSN